MATDLTTARDHPANVLRAAAASAESEGLARAAHSLAVAAETLNGYEAREKVTFAALDNAALAEVRKEYLRYVENQPHALGAALDSLFGLEP